MRRFCCSLWWLGLACILAGGSAHAHATLIEATPADGSVVANVPAEVRLRFNEPVSPVVVHLVDARGVERRDAHVEAHDAIIAIHVPADLPSGTQVVSYRVISSDGHPVGGSIVFSIGSATAARPSFIRTRSRNMSAPGTTSLVTATCRTRYSPN